MPPTSTVRCINPECADYGVDRAVSAVEVGVGLTAFPTPIQCSCGRPVRVVDRHNGPPSPPEMAVRSAPEKRGRRRG